MLPHEHLNLAEHCLHQGQLGIHRVQRNPELLLLSQMLQNLVLLLVQSVGKPVLFLLRIYFGHHARFDHADQMRVGIKLRSVVTLVSFHFFDSEFEHDSQRFVTFEVLCCFDSFHQADLGHLVASAAVHIVLLFEYCVEHRLPSHDLLRFLLKFVL